MHKVIEANESHGKYEFCIDRPLSSGVIVYDDREILVSGWAEPGTFKELKIRIVSPDKTEATITANLPRPDVHAHFQSQGKSIDENCGFSTSIPSPALSSLPGTISIEIIADGNTLAREELPIAEFTSMQWQDAPGIEEASGGIRADYKAAWNEISETQDAAKLAVAGYVDEDEFAHTAESGIELIKSTVGLKDDDEILEIGCGVARLGKALANRCKHWTGVDVSENMIAHARERTRGIDNIDFITSNGWDLQAVPSNSKDLVYCLVVFMHLDEWERYNYICEAFRVLKPGGRLLVNNYNLLSKEGWSFFMEHMVSYHPMQRPSNVSKSSTPQELLTYLEKAGFSQRESTNHEGLFVEAWGTKPVS